jgi:hypothetical protein
MLSSNNSPKLFNISLRLIAAAVVLFASTFLAVGAGTACSKEAKAFLDLMSTMPDSTSQFTYWNTDDLNTDEDLWDIFGKFKESADVQQLDRIVLVLATVKQSARAVSYDNTSPKNPVTVLHGDFDVNYIEGQLETIGCSQTRYKDIGIWTLEDNQTLFKSVALRSTAVLMGDASDLRTCIDVSLKSSTQSLKGDPNIRLVADKLPNGVIVEIDKFNLSHGEQYPDLVTYGKSYTKADKDTLKVTAVYMFGDGPAAGAALTQIRDYLAATFQEVKIRRDGNFVIAISRVPIISFAQILEY